MIITPPQNSHFKEINRLCVWAVKEAVGTCLCSFHAPTSDTTTQEPARAPTGASTPYFSLLALFIMQSWDSHVHIDGILMCEGFLTLLLFIYFHLYLFSYFLFTLQASTNNHSKFRATSQTSGTVFSASFSPYHLAEQRNPMRCDKLRFP